ncbi:MAG: aminoacyl-histidine dipeptidase [Bacteroidales bacterium]|nr:aminoacyl-histidine dipeptidase [Bacteroidales bacterium]MCF8405248.1 aminoacyl-histidine dipeptidase [Bacteroidales bacterium]
MSKEILNLEPKSVWKHFYSLTQIPRPSKNEARVIAFVKKFGEDLGLETIVDTVGNVIIKKPATPGMENRKGVILQGHLDMVPQKNSATKHDFLNDPIDAYIDGEWVTAKGTTLGSDNGMGVAAAMAVLEAKDLKHGPVEALFTMDEETGMTGAENLQPGVLDGDILLNMDSEDEGELYIGCAGGVDTTAVFNYKEEAVPAGTIAYKISVTGLKGGHSGLDIHLGKGNACLILNKTLINACERFGIRLASIDAGSLRNAIPREAFSTVMVPGAEENNFLEFIKEAHESVAKMYKATEPDVKITTEKTSQPTSIIDANTENNFYNAVSECPNGVIAWDENMPDVVETSSNLAIIKSEAGKITIAILTRSAVDAERDKAAADIGKVFREYGAEAKHHGAYPGWKPDINSPILETMKKVYNDSFGRVPEVKVIHAGLECGILGAIYPHWDMISFGPTIRFPHSPDEKVKIDTVKKFWDFLVYTLKNIPVK